MYDEYLPVQQFMLQFFESHFNINLCNYCFISGHSYVRKNISPNVLIINCIQFNKNSNILTRKETAFESVLCKVCFNENHALQIEFRKMEL